MKDKGILGFLLAREIGATPYMYFCTREEDYPYLKNLNGLNLVCSGDDPPDSKMYDEHLAQNYQKMDILILHGAYPDSYKFLHAYRKYRPDGKVYCGLDMSRQWMARIDWSDSRLHAYTTQCDMVSTSCTTLRDALNLNREVNFPCRYLPNGFFNPGNHRIVADANIKENVIITVGRIGNVIKNNIELMIGFANASDKLKGWKLKLIGGIDPEFQHEIDEFFSLRPDLKKRIIFTGAITDKQKLYDEYAKAKIFVLTSTTEGGTPNVYAEALFHGCMFVTSDLSSAKDMTNNETLGITYELGNDKQLAAALVKLAKRSDTKHMKEHIPKALAYAKDNFDWERNIKKLAYSLLL